MNIVECPEFRELLLCLRETLQDNEIPHRTRIRQAVLEAWAESFHELKEELAVSAAIHLHLISPH